MLKGLAILLLMLVAGEGLRLLTQWPIPGNMFGMVLMFLSLQLGVVKVAEVQAVADVLLKNLWMLFVPFGVAIAAKTDVLMEQGAAILMAVLLSTFAVLAVVGWSAQSLMHRELENRP